MDQLVRFTFGYLVTCFQYYDGILDRSQMEQTRLCPNKHCKEKVCIFKDFESFEFRLSMVTQTF